MDAMNYSIRTNTTNYCRWHVADSFLLSKEFAHQKYSDADRLRYQAENNNLSTLLNFTTPELKKILVYPQTLVVTSFQRQNCSPQIQLLNVYMQSSVASPNKETHQEIITGLNFHFVVWSSSNCASTQVYKSGKILQLASLVLNA